MLKRREMPPPNLLVRKFLGYTFQLADYASCSATPSPSPSPSPAKAPEPPKETPPPSSGGGGGETHSGGQYVVSLRFLSLSLTLTHAALPFTTKTESLEPVEV